MLHQQQMQSPLLVLDATVKFESASESEKLNQDVLQGINKTNLKDNEILTEISFKIPRKILSQVLENSVEELFVNLLDKYSLFV